MIFLVLIALLFETSAGLNLRQLPRRPDKNLAAKLMIFNEEQSREVTKQQINQQTEHSNRILAEFAFNHQECDMIIMPGRRRQVRCHHETSDLGKHYGLFKPFAYAAKWFQSR